MVEIESKEDSAEKLAAVNGKPTKYYLFASEFNQLVSAINELAVNPVFSEFITYIPPIKEGVNFTAPANQSWKINGLVYGNTVDIEDVIPLAASGLKRFDLFLAGINNTFVRFPGEESVNPFIPNKPNNTLVYAVVLVTDTEIGDPIIPILGEPYITKAQEGIHRIDLTGVIDNIELDKLTHITFNDSITEIRGYNFSGSDNQLYTGKTYSFTNLQSTPIILKHDSPYGAFRFFLKNNQDFVLKPTQTIQFYFTNFGELRHIIETVDYFIPLTGTEAGKPVTGNILVDDGAGSTIELKKTTGQVVVKYQDESEEDITNINSGGIQLISTLEGETTTAGMGTTGLSAYDALNGSRNFDYPKSSGRLAVETGQKTITGNVTLDDTYNGCILKVKSIATITIPSTLQVNFNCVIRSFTGATTTFVAGSGVTMDAPKGLILDPFKMATLFKDGSTSTYVLEGELKP